MTYSYECTDKECINSNGFDIEASIKDKPLEKCHLCSSKINRIYKSIGVSLMFEGSYNNTRK